jgi:hypothetical protein
MTVENVCLSGPKFCLRLCQYTTHSDHHRRHEDFFALLALSCPSRQGGDCSTISKPSGARAIPRVVRHREIRTGISETSKGVLCKYTQSN